MSPENSDKIPVDSHSHLHPSYDAADTLDRALASFSSARDVTGESSPAGILLFADPNRYSTLDRLQNTREALYRRGWVIEPTAQSCTLRATHRKARRSLLLVGGRQIATADGLEILALGTSERLPDGRDFRDSLRMVAETEALAVVPWGFGKWWGRRGRLVEEMLDRTSPNEVFLGDNGGRPSSYPRHRLLRRAHRSGRPVLPGSDPLPFPREHRRIGSCGILAPSSIGSGDSPLRSLIEWLRGSERNPETYCTRVSTWRFAFRQIQMQLQKVGS